MSTNRVPQTPTKRTKSVPTPYTDSVHEGDWYFARAWLQGEMDA